MSPKLKARMEELARGMPGMIRSPHEDDLFCEGFQSAHNILMPLIEEMMQALEYYASATYYNDHNYIITNGSVAQEALDSFEEVLGE